MKTFELQDELPSLPLSPVDETMDELLASGAPLCLNAKEAADFRAAVEAFRSNAHSIQTWLERRAAASRNWLEDWWEEGYLQNRGPNAFFVNWFGSVPPLFGATKDDGPSDDLNQVEVAAWLISGILLFKRELDEQRLPPECAADGSPLCMAQYQRIFTSCVVPRPHQDELRIFPQQAEHISVLCNGHIYSINVQNPDVSSYAAEATGEVGSISFAENIATALQWIQEESERARGADASVLTSLPREEWAAARTDILRLSSANNEALEAIESALFVVSLVNAPTDSLAASAGAASRSGVRLLHDPADSATASAVLFGDGLNRWHDKPFTLFVYPDNRIALNGEHCFADAVVVLETLRRASEFCRRAACRLLPRPSEKEAEMEKNSTSKSSKLRRVVPALLPRALAFDLSPRLVERVLEAKQAARKVCERFVVAVAHFRGLGTTQMKSCGAPPDSLVQVCLQLAAARLGVPFPSAAYETAHTRRFYHGRTEAVRSLSSESAAFVNLALNPNAIASAKAEALRAALARHRQTARRAAAATGVDRHLLGLERVVTESKSDSALNVSESARAAAEALFADPVFRRSRRWLLSTSAVSSGGKEMPAWAGYAPAVEPEGVGLCYAIERDELHAVASVYRAGYGADGAFKLLEELKRAIEEGTALLAAHGGGPLRKALAAKL